MKWASSCADATSKVDQCCVQLVSSKMNYIELSRTHILVFHLLVLISLWVTGHHLGVVQLWWAQNSEQCGKVTKVQCIISKVDKDSNDNNNRFSWRGFVKNETGEHTSTKFIVLTDVNGFRHELCVHQYFKEACLMGESTAQWFTGFLNGASESWKRRRVWFPLLQALLK